MKLITVKLRVRNSNYCLDNPGNQDLPEHEMNYSKTARADFEILLRQSWKTGFTGTGHQLKLRVRISKYCLAIIGILDLLEQEINHIEIVSFLLSAWPAFGGP